MSASFRALAALVVFFAALYHTAIGGVLRAGARSAAGARIDVRPLSYYFPPLGASEPALGALAGTRPPGPETAFGRALQEALTQLPADEATSVKAALAARGFHSPTEQKLELAARVLVAETGCDDSATFFFLCGVALARFAKARGGAAARDDSVETLASELPPGACPQSSAALVAMTLLTAYRLHSPLQRPALVSSPFGPRLHPLSGEEKFHAGIDLAVADGTRVLAAGPGEVARAGNVSGFGGYVSIAHGHGVVSSYAHLSRWSVAPAEHIALGQKIADSGHSGAVTGPHMHFVVQIGGAPNDPLRVVVLNPER